MVNVNTDQAEVAMGIRSVYSQCHVDSLALLSKMQTIMGNLGGVISRENTPEGCTETHKSSFFAYRQVSGRNSDHE